MTTFSGVHRFVQVGLEWCIIVATKIGIDMVAEVWCLMRNTNQSILGAISCKADLAR
jgi:hypothetical protein